MREGAGRVQTFTGRTMPEALRRVRGGLGADAVILQARHVWSRTWWGRRDRGVEVTAGLPVSFDMPLDAPGGGRGPDSGRLRATPGPSARAALPPAAVGPGQEPLAREVAALRGAVDLLIERDAKGPKANSDLRKDLRLQGLPEDLIAGLLRRVTSGPGARASLLSLIERLVPTSGPVKLRARAPTRIALIGPTGVGKTTTIAKLAAHFRVREGRSVGFIAADTYRIAAVDQLGRYAELLGSPMRIARNPRDVSRAVAALSTSDVVFIDTAGRSQRDELRMRELGAFLDAARADEVHLVLSLTSERSSFFSAIDRFVPLGANRLILSKLDEAERGGAILQASARAGLPVSYLTTGQEVPDDIEVAESGTLARLVLGGPGARERRAWDGPPAIGSAAPRQMRRSA